MKPLDEFSRNKSKRDGRQTKCKICQKEYHKKVWYPKNRDRHIASVKKGKLQRRNRHFIKILKEYFINGCIDCGEKDDRILEFDHVRGVKKRTKNRGTDGVMGLVRQGYSWRVIKEEIDKCEVRCRNCHKIKTYEEFNYYKDLRDEIKEAKKG